MAANRPIFNSFSRGASMSSDGENYFESEPRRRALLAKVWSANATDDTVYYGRIGPAHL